MIPNLSRLTRAVRHNDLITQTWLTPSSALESQYQCLYGIASSSSGLSAGEIDIGYDEKRSTLAIVGKDDRTYYFVFEKLEKTYKPPHIPSYTVFLVLSSALRLACTRYHHFSCLLRPSANQK
jgi:hypothetical protein